MDVIAILVGVVGFDLLLLAVVVLVLLVVDVKAADAAAELDGVPM